jgi:nucleoside-diphosphate-sugar epimerase
MQITDKTKKVLVTGGSGYLASWIIKKLLDQGVSVHATVRDPLDDEKTAHLKALDKNDRLTLFKADLLDIGSFNDAMQGCDLVIHTASPFFISGFKDAKTQLIDPAKLGTRNVLETARQMPGIKRVVLTSSVAAVYGDNVDIKKTARGVFTEDVWNQTSSIDHLPYSFSKTLAEKEAWKIAKSQDQWDLVVINPGLIFGPSLTKRKDSFSIKTMIEFGNGSYRTGIPEIYSCIADVRDVAEAHIRAGFIPEAKGRHIVVSKSIPFMQIADIIRKNFKTNYPLPKMRVPKFVFWLIAPFMGFTRKYVTLNIGHPIEFDSSYARGNLKLSYRPIEETITDHFQQIIDHNLLK